MSPEPNCIAEKIETAQNVKVTADDLNAQQEMADWAWWMLLINVLMFVATAIGVWFVKRTLDATLKAVSDSSRAADAMLRQNEISEESMRPWIFIKSTKVHSLETMDNGKTLWVNVVFEIQNVGKRPAKIPLPKQWIRVVRDGEERFSDVGGDLFATVHLAPGAADLFPGKIQLEKGDWFSAHFPYEWPGGKGRCGHYFTLEFQNKNWNIPRDGNQIFPLHDGHGVHVAVMENLIA